MRISQLRNSAVPASLYGAILARIVELKRRSAFIRAAGLLGLSAVSVIGLLQASIYAADESYLSGFSDYLKLLFTDHDVALASWREFALSLAESLPALPLALLCAALLVLVWSLVRAARNFKLASHYTSVLTA